MTAPAYDPATRNYAGQRVSIPPGSVVSGGNFAQRVPNTPAIECDGALTLEGCNLVNVTLDPRWALTECNTAQMWRFETTTDLDNPDSPPRVEVTTQFAARHPSELPDPLVAPDGAVTEA